MPVDGGFIVAWVFLCAVMLARWLFDAPPDRSAQHSAYAAADRAAAHYDVGRPPRWDEVADPMRPAVIPAEVRTPALVAARMAAARDANAHTPPTVTALGYALPAAANVPLQLFLGNETPLRAVLSRALEALQPRDFVHATTGALNEAGLKALVVGVLQPGLAAAKAKLHTELHCAQVSGAAAAAGAGTGAAAAGGYADVVLTRDDRAVVVELKCFSPKYLQSGWSIRAPSYSRFDSAYSARRDGGDGIGRARAASHWQQFAHHSDADFQDLPLRNFVDGQPAVRSIRDFLALAMEQAARYGAALARARHVPVTCYAVVSVGTRVVAAKPLSLAP